MTVSSFCQNFAKFYSSLRFTGAGYHLVMVKKTTCDVLKIDAFLKSYIPEAKMESNIGTELSFLLPHDSSPLFQRLFSAMEGQQEELGISSYGVTVTTMEEVFLRFVNIL